jgi:hypothetical protein
MSSIEPKKPYVYLSLWPIASLLGWLWSHPVVLPGRYYMFLAYPTSWCHSDNIIHHPFGSCLQGIYSIFPRQSGFPLKPVWKPPWSFDFCILHDCKTCTYEQHQVLQPVESVRGLPLEPVVQWPQSASEVKHGKMNPGEPISWTALCNQHSPVFSSQSIVFQSKWVVHAYNAALRREWKEICEFDTSMGYVANSRPVWDVSWKPVLKANT